MLLYNRSAASETLYIRFLMRKVNCILRRTGWEGDTRPPLVVSTIDTHQEGPGFNSRLRRAFLCWVCTLFPVSVWVLLRFPPQSSKTMMGLTSNWCPPPNALIWGSGFAPWPPRSGRLLLLRRRWVKKQSHPCDQSSIFSSVSHISTGR